MAIDQMVSTSPMAGMEHPQNTLSVPPLVNGRVRLRFCEAIQSYADTVGSHDEAATKLRNLGARLDNLQALARLSRLAILGHPHSFQRLVDELHCLSVDFPSDPLEKLGEDSELHEDEPDDRVLLTAAIDLFAGAAFVSKYDRGQRDRFMVGIVRAIEDAVAFPVTFAAEAGTFIGDVVGEESFTHARIVMANATQRLLDSDQKCVPLVPAEIRVRLYCLARTWMDRNPVTEFFTYISGPRLRRIVHWEDPSRSRPDDARVGDQVTLVLGDDTGVRQACGWGEGLDDLAVVFCPHQPAAVVRTVDDGLQVLVPNRARTGPIAVVKKAPDFAPVRNLVSAYAGMFPLEWSLSLFGYVRMDMWAYPCAFGRPIIEILASGQAPPQKPVNPTPNPVTPPNEPANPTSNAVR